MKRYCRLSQSFTEMFLTWKKFFIVLSSIHLFYGNNVKEWSSKNNMNDSLMAFLYGNKITAYLLDMLSHHESHALFYVGPNTLIAAEYHLTFNCTSSYSYVQEVVFDL